MFFERFQILCLEKGISPTRASAEIGFSKGSVSYWRKQYNRGIDAQPDTRTAQKIADYFNVSVDYLLGRNQPDPLMEFSQAQQRKKSQVLRDSTSPIFWDHPVLTDREWLLIQAYRCHPEAQETVDQLLGMADTDQGEKA